MSPLEYNERHDFQFAGKNYSAMFGYSQSPDLMFTISDFEPHIPITFQDGSFNILTFKRSVNPKEIELVTIIGGDSTIVSTVLIPKLLNLYADLI